MGDDDVKHIWSDTYNFFLRYKDIDIMDHIDEVILAYQTIEDNYDRCRLVKDLLDCVMQVFKDRSEKYQELVKGAK